MENLLTIEQTAQRLQLDKTTVRRQIKKGDLRGIKRGGQWRVPESALMESSAKPTATERSAEVETVWSDMMSGDSARRKEALRQLFAAPESVQAIVMQRSAEVAARFYATTEGEAELADWRALDGQPFDDEAGDYYTPEEEAEFRAQQGSETATVMLTTR